VFNGQRPEAWQLRQAIARRGWRVRYLEDGFDTYVGRASQPVGVVRRIGHRWLLRSPHPLTVDMMTALPASSIHVLAPELARVAGDRASLERIPVEAFVSAVEQLGERVRHVVPAGRKATHLYVSKHTESIADRRAYLAGIAEWAERSGSGAAVKPHPRETDSGYLRELAALGVDVLPHWMPSELLAGFLDPACAVVCAPSTFVLTSRFTLPGRTIELPSPVDPEIADRLRAWDPAISVARERDGVEVSA
jgi:hypothetical protein